MRLLLAFLAEKQFKISNKQRPFFVMKTETENKEQGRVKKTYGTPHLIRYGVVEKLTQSGGSTQPDAHQAQQHHPGGGGRP